MATKLKKALPDPPAPTLVCVLRSTGSDRQSRNGFVWPVSGPVECPDWKPTKECGNGLHGLLWGVGDWSLCRTTDPNAVWQVVEVDAATLVDLDGKVKFPRGEVIHCGSLAGALGLTNSRHFEVLKQKAIKGGAATTGDCAPAATTGSRAPAATTGDCAPAATTGYGAPAATTGDCAPAATAGDCAPAATAGSRAPAATTGYGAPAATTGDCAPAATTGYGAPAATTGDCAPAACIGLAGRAKAGPNSSIILTYRDAADRTRHAVGYVGEDGIEPHVWYEVTTEGKLARSADQADPQ